MTAKIVRKTIEEAKKMPMAEIDFSYKNLVRQKKSYNTISPPKKIET